MLELPSSSPPSPAAPSSPAHASSSGQRLWGILLVLDSLFVIVFGGALAAKIYQHWQAPPAAVAARRRPNPPVKPAPPAPKPTETKAPEPEPPKPKPVEPPKNAPVPKPSLINEPPKHAAAAPKETAKPPTPAANANPNGVQGGSRPLAEPSAAKAVPVEFHFSAPDAKKVELYGAFIVRGNGRKKMSRQSDGSWKLTLYLNPNSYRYHFLVDGKKTLDPDNAQTLRGDSLLTVSPR